MDMDAVIIGAGVVGLAVAAEISTRLQDVCVIEKHATFGRETSSRNSEVIHAGIYYPEDSLKARLCVAGKQRLYQLCREKRIPYRRCGKFIVATDRMEKEQLESIHAKAIKNGVDDIERCSRHRIHEQEPDVEAILGLYSPSTGIVDSHRLMAYLEGRAQNNGAHLVYKTRVAGIETIDAHHFRIEVINPDGGRSSLDTRWLINCAGLEADRLAARLGIDTAANQYTQYFYKGAYFAVRGKAHRIKTLVYPVPMPKQVGLGVHATIDLSGQLKLGPDSSYIADRSYDYAVDAELKNAFFESAVRFLTFLRPQDLSPAMAGIRPTLQKPGDGMQDFIIREESDNGFPGFINLLGMDSPGLTSCLAIAEYVGNML